MLKVDPRSVPEIHNLRNEARHYGFPENSEQGAALQKKVAGIWVKKEMMERSIGGSVYDSELDALLTKQGFQRYDSVRGVYETEDAPGWLIKRYRSGRTGVAKVGLFKGYDYKDVVFAHHYNNAYRVIMQRKAAEAVAKLGLKIVVPEEYLIPLPCDEEVPPYARYLVASRKIEVLDTIDTTEKLASLTKEQQIAVAHQVCRFIAETGMIDANWRNFALTKNTVQYEGQEIPEVASLDSEPFGTLTDSEDRPPRRIDILNHPENPERSGRLCLRVARLYGFREFANNCEKRGLHEMSKVARWYLKTYAGEKRRV